jgi:MFS family permease
LPAISSEATVPASWPPASGATPSGGPLAKSNQQTIPAAARTIGSTDSTLVDVSATVKSSAGTEATMPTVTPGKAPSAPSERAAGAPDRIGGYRILRELGRGAMGAVYLARQLSLDRNVALKTIQAQWASHPTFVARFTREAYAAAQLTHHNVVQIYDLGLDRGTHYFSMEFVRGESLDDTIKRTGPLAPEVAVGYLLQAARGLQFAHSHGMIHRDIKPANMMLNDQGVVKIADLGLVKVGSSDTDGDVADASGVAPSDSLAAAKADVTMLNVAMGTPAYMAPEQTDNAAGVDHRADIYSLGCSLYVLLTGKPPFEGASALEVMTKHRLAPVVRPDAVLANIPKELADITLKMVAKQPEQRYQTVSELIRDLEQFLARGSAGKMVPTPEQAEQVNQQSKRFQQAGLARLRSTVAIGFVGGCAALSLVLLPFSWSLSGAMVGLLFSALATAFVVTGLSGRSPLFDRARALVFASSLSDWLMALGGALVFVLLLWLIGWLGVWLVAVVLGVGLGFGYSYLFGRRLAEQRREPVEQIESLLRGWRVMGLEENALRRVVADNAGEHWEELFESLFGYESLCAMRRQLSESGDTSRRARFRSWREPLIRWFDQRLTAKREERDRRLLQKLEEQNLRSQGVAPAAAKQQAGRIAEALVVDAAAARAPVPQAAPAAVDPKVAAAQKRERVKRMLAEAKSDAKPARQWGAAATLLAPLAFAFSGKVRFLLGCLLIAGCALWARQNQIFSGEDLASVAKEVTQDLQEGGAKDLVRSVKLQTAEPLRLPIVGPYFNSWYPGIAGLLLIVASFFRGGKMSLFILPAAAVMVVGPVMMSSLRVVMLLTGLVLGVVGLIFGRSGD